MRAAAEALAEVDPADASRGQSAGMAHDRATRSHAPLAEQGRALQRAIQAAVDAELARELASPDLPGMGRTPSSVRADGSADSGKEDRDQAHGAALQAQGAKVIGTQHNQSVTRQQGKMNLTSADGGGSVGGTGKGQTATSLPARLR
jgi:hypothetical protein